MDIYPDNMDKDIKALSAAHFKDKPERFLNRELSWLAFNRRVLEEANNLNHPLYERVRYVSICAGNMDEFYMVRVAGLKAQIKANITTRSNDGLSPQEQLGAIRIHALQLMSDLQATWRGLLEELEKNEIKVLSITEPRIADSKWLAKYFESEVLPVLTPMALDPAHPFPFIPNKGLSIIVKLYDQSEKEDLNVLIQIPTVLPRFVKLRSAKDRYMLIEKLIMRHIHDIFPDHCDVKSYATFRVIRDGELEIEEEAEDLVLTFETALKKRRRGNVIHLSVHHNIDPVLLDYLVKELNIRERQVMQVEGLVGLTDCQQIIDDTKDHLLFRPYDARFPERIREFGGDCFAAIKQKDIIVHHPFESFDVVVQFLRQAARDPNVVSIKQTLYRTSKDSPIVSALIEAAEAGKSVTALVELKARFDEEANLRWARDMERAGVQVVYGFIDLKTHAKVSMVVRREGEHLVSYAHLGTGNYHPINAKIYTDLSFFTCNKDICHDTARLFNYMTGYALPQDLEKIAISPLNLRDTLTALIDNEITNAKAGKPAQIWAKCNALLDGNIIDKLYEASQAGVEIELIVRGICTLRPGIPGLSENIKVKSIVGRYLEHSRIYCFANGKPMPSGKNKVFISSADLMERNLDRRIEAFVPIENKTVHKQVLHQIMVAYLKDSKQSWLMQYDGSYERPEQTEDEFCAHDYFMNNPSLSGRGKALLETSVPPRLSLKNRKDYHTNKKGIT